jgi:hypothetical protein
MITALRCLVAIHRPLVGARKLSHRFSGVELGSNEGGDAIDNGLVSRRRTTRQGAVDSEINGARNAFALLGISDLPIRAFVAKDDLLL